MKLFNWLLTLFVLSVCLKIKIFFTYKKYDYWGEKVISIYKSSSDESKRQRLKHGSIQEKGILWDFFKAQDWTVYDKDGSVIHE